MRQAHERPSACARRLVIPAIAVLLPGCAAQGHSPLRPADDGRQTVVVTTQAGTAEAILRRDTHVAVASLPATRSEAWEPLLDAWAEVGLPEPVADRRAFTVSISNHPIQRRLARTPLSQYLSCGISISGPNADSHRIRLTVNALLEGAGEERSVLHVRVEAVAHSTEGASATPIQCATLGKLEAAIVNYVQRRLGPA
ncbi:MAG TPA: hypothetical protein VK936_04080 [Longimicrobiales bacterium]|nr:hypothetical protein [Longimicrobiales bacterium]